MSHSWEPLPSIYRSKQEFLASLPPWRRLLQKLNWRPTVDLKVRRYALEQRLLQMQNEDEWLQSEDEQLQSEDEWLQNEDARLAEHDALMRAEDERLRKLDERLAELDARLSAVVSSSSTSSSPPPSTHEKPGT